MAFITNQHLKGEALKNRPHLPRSVSLKTTKDDRDDWSKENNISWSLRATRRDGDYQCLYFTKKDLDDTLPELIKGASANGQMDVAYVALMALTDSQLLEVMRHVFSRRPVERPGT